jgi:hypothetical protein
MKKLTYFIFLIITSIHSQNNLEFNQTLNLNIVEPETVPSGKTWKITSATHNEIKIDGVNWPTLRKEIWGGDIAMASNLPIWVSEGKTISWTANNYISVLEFNITPLSSSNSTNSSSSATTTSGGEYVSLNDNLYTQVSSQSENMTYVEALNYCSQLVEDGFDDWILGNYQQWESYIANTASFPSEGISSWVRVLPIDTFSYSGHSYAMGLMINLDSTGYGQFYPTPQTSHYGNSGAPIAERNCRCLR